MAKAKVVTSENALTTFLEIIARLDLPKYVSVNNTLLGYDENERKVMITVSPALWNIILESKFTFTELDLNEPDEYNLKDWFITEELEHCWIPFPDLDSLYKGIECPIKITNNKETVDVPITRELLPMKLRKAEFKDIFYRAKNEVLALKKEYLLSEDYSFALTRLFKIL